MDVHILFIQAGYSVGSLTENLRITEIMYHPNDLGDPNSEFIELTNIGDETINLNLVKFTNGIDFTFDDITLAPGEYLVVIKDLEAFSSTYNDPAIDIASLYSGNLANGGERIRLEDAVGQTILDFNYSDNWYNITDGDGFSLTAINPAESDPNIWSQKEFWRASVFNGGSPGWDDSGINP